jgi:uncharacterized iron-regulated membrane protein
MAISEIPEAVESRSSEFIDEVVDVAPKQKKRKSSGLYQMVWRWHFYAGLFTAPFITVVSLTGLIYLYAAEIETTIRSNEIIVEPLEQRLPPSQIVAAAHAVYPDWNPTNILMPAQQEFAAAVTVTDASAESEQVVLVNPYTAKVTGEFDHKNDPLHNFFHVVLDIHRSLFAGIPGRIVTETVTSWAVILLITGAFLWWPRKKDKVNGVLVPRLSKGRKAFLRDIHALFGFYFLPVLIVIVSTGLFYSLGIGSAVATGNSLAFAEPAESTPDAANQKEEQSAEPNIPSATGDEIDAAYKLVKAKFPSHTTVVSLKDATGDTVSVSSYNSYERATYGKMKFIQYKVDPRSNSVIEETKLADNPGYWWHGWVYPTHVGTIGGPYTKAIWFVACIVMTVLPVTGLMLWWKRRPRGKSGFPKRNERKSRDRPAWLSWLIISLCVILPTAGISLIAIVVFEKFRGLNKKVLREP